MTEPDYRIEVRPATFAPIHHMIDNQQRYVLYLSDTGAVFRLDTWRGDTWLLAANGEGQYWKPFVDNHAEQPPDA